MSPPALLHPLPRRDVLLHDHDLGSRDPSQKDVCLLVIPVSVASQNDLDVGHVEAKRFHALFDEGNRPLEVRIDEDVALGGRNQKGAQAASAHEVQVVHHLVCWERIIPTVL